MIGQIRFALSSRILEIIEIKSLDLAQFRCFQNSFKNTSSWASASAQWLFGEEFIEIYILKNKNWLFYLVLAQFQKNETFKNKQTLSAPRMCSVLNWALDAPRQTKLAFRLARAPQVTVLPAGLCAFANETTA